MKKYNKPVAWRFEEGEYNQFKLACLARSVALGRKVTPVEIIREAMQKFTAKYKK